MDWLESEKAKRDARFRKAQSQRDQRCAEPDKPVVPCGYCESAVYTCGHPTGSGPPWNDYRCPVHPDGFEERGQWWCSSVCYHEKTSDEMWELQEALVEVVEELIGKLEHVHREYQECFGCKARDRSAAVLNRVADWKAKFDPNPQQEESGDAEETADPAQGG